MMRGGQACGSRFAFFALPMVVTAVLSGCVPPGAITAPSLEDPAALPQRPGGMISGRDYVLGQAVAREHDRNNTLQQQIQQQAHEMQDLHAQLDQLRQREGELRAALDRALAGSGPSPSLAGSGVEKGKDAQALASDRAEPAMRQPAAAATAEDRRQAQAEQEHQATVERLQTALTQEQQRRQEVETQLARLKEETSTPPYAQNNAADAELSAAKQQVAELRAALDEERSARERLAQDFRALQRRTASADAGADSMNAENADLRLRLQQLQEEKQNLTQSFNRSLAESQQRAADLERQLDQTHSGAPSNVETDGAAAGVQAENTALRSRLDEEHRRTEELAAKLKVAMRVTDLIFKMQAQQTQPRY